MIGSSISSFIDMNFVLSATSNLFLGLIFLLMIWLIFSKVRSSRFAWYAMVETFIIASHPAGAKKKSVISFSPPFSLSSFSFLVLALAAKHRIQASTKSGSSRDNWYPIGDAIVMMYKVSISQSLIKFLYFLLNKILQNSTQEEHIAANFCGEGKGRGAVLPDYEKSPT